MGDRTQKTPKLGNKFLPIMKTFSSSGNRSWHLKYSSPISYHCATEAVDFFILQTYMKRTRRPTEFFWILFYSTGAKQVVTCLMISDNRPWIPVTQTVTSRPPPGGSGEGSWTPVSSLTSNPRKICLTPWGRYCS